MASLRFLTWVSALENTNTTWLQINAHSFFILLVIAPIWACWSFSPPWPPLLKCFWVRLLVIFKSMSFLNVSSLSNPVFEREQACMSLQKMGVEEKYPLSISFAPFPYTAPVSLCLGLVNGVSLLTWRLLCTLCRRVVMYLYSGL